LRSWQESYRKLQIEFVAKSLIPRLLHVLTNTPASSSRSFDECHLSELRQINSYRFRLALWTFPTSWFNIASLCGNQKKFFTELPDFKEVIYEKRKVDATVGLMLLPGLMTAQSLTTSTVVAQVPVEFKVSNTIIPVGECVIRSMGMEGQILGIRNFDARKSALALWSHGEANQAAGGAARFGHRPRLLNIWPRLTGRFGLGEKARLQLVAEGFNILNRPNFAAVNNVVGVIGRPFDLHASENVSPSTGLGYTGVLAKREIQLGLRFTF
jgi:hypothetical protein